jgi:hypothetical protein
MPVDFSIWAKAGSTKSRVTNNTSQATMATLPTPGFSITTATLRNWPSCPVGQHARFGHGRHEVRVTVPARHQVQMQMAGKPGARDTPRVRAVIHPVRGVRVFDRALGESGERQQILAFSCVQFREAAGMAPDRHHEMRGIVGVPVEHQQRPGQAREHEVLSIRARPVHGAEQTARRLVGRADVSHPPGRPQPVQPGARHQREPPERNSA